MSAYYAPDIIMYVSLKKNYSILILFIKGPKMLVTEIWNLLPWYLPEIKLLLPSGGFPSDSDGKESAYNAGDPSLIPGSGRSPGEWHGHPFQYFCPWGHKELDTTERLHFHFHSKIIKSNL